MRIQIIICPITSSHKRELILWETLTVKSLDEADAHCRRVEENNENVYTAFFAILGE